ncbi:MAG: carbamoyltransferase HypF [Nitrospinae bacterium]|nr:carbamoyltransferase HypF [Nitrospinota bacterium]
MPDVRRKIDVKGIVQGVGFRPFVYNLAISMGLSGSVLNNRLGVSIEIQGSETACREFLRALEENAPPTARIAQVNVADIPAVPGECGFKILHSDADGDGITLVSPDNDVCPDCLREMLDPADRRYRYPFINCTHCGPRYTIIRQTPYDRPFTSMANFKMCPDCQKEYDDPADRRFHAQPNACPVCGPALTLYDAEWKTAPSSDPIADVARLLGEGRLIAIKGIGGYHFACDAANEDAVEELRRRKLRKEKPFAVMSASVDDVRGYARVGPLEEKFLLSREKPITLLRRIPGRAVCDGIAPGLHEYGVFLPYTPVHHLLFASGAPTTLVMTSGNIADEPIVFDEAEMRGRLCGIADYHLTHNRPIVWRCDDSIVRVADGKPAFPRRSRGYVPSPVFLEKKLSPMLACGGDLKNVFCLANGETVFPGPHIGDLVNAEANRSFRESIAHFQRMFRILPERVAVDMHPGYFSSNYGRSLGLPVVEVQHHHAHIASVMAEHRLAGEVIGVALDGTGYGTDGTVWGGEVMVCGFSRFERRGYFPPLKLPGGDKAAKEPWRTAVAVLYEIFGEDLFDLHPKFVQAVGETKVKNVAAMLEADVNCPISNAAGRWFDAVSSILLIGHANSFEGQSPILLEGMADASVEKEFTFGIGADGMLEFENMMRELVCMAETQAGRIKGASMFHNTVARAIAESCSRVSHERGLKEVCLGGGVFQNLYLLERTLKLLREAGFTVYLPKQLPINDGGLALGQIAIAQGIGVE